MSADTILFGDCRDLLRQLAETGTKVQMCVTSPPYFGLRDYGHDGQIGLEETPEQYIAKLVEVFRCVREVLADDGTLWVNIGDTYAANRGRQVASTLMNGDVTNVAQAGAGRGMKAADCGVKEKDLIGIPWMLAFALRADGWYLRQDIIWHKPNPMPESVTDRCTKAHEYVFLLSKGPRYFYDSEAVKEPAVGNPSGNAMRKQRPSAEVLQRGSQAGSVPWDGGDKRNRRTVWTIATKPYHGAHFAVFPPALVEPCLLASTSERGHCPRCGARWQRVTEKTTSFQGGSGRAGRSAEDANATGKHIGGIHGGNKNLKLGPVVSTTTTGWKAACDCGLPAMPDIVLDPFMGSGTTAAVAIEHGRQFIGCELNPAYKPLQDQRIAQARAKVAQLGLGLQGGF
ncbi:MAG: DNA-methyltransferase [Telluria sp.]